MNYLETHILESLIYLPMLTALVLILLPNGRQDQVRQISIISSFLLLLGSLYVFIIFDHSPSAAPFQMERTYPWVEQLGISIRLGVDGLAVPMVVLTGLVAFTGVLISWNIERESKNFFVLFFLLVAGVYGTFISVDLFFFFFFYELAVVPMYLLIGVWGSSSSFATFVRTKEYSAMKLTIYLVAGSVLVWIGIIAIYVSAGAETFDIRALQEASQNGALDTNFQRIIFPLIMIGFGALAGLWPFHTWSPDGHVAAPTAVSMLHAGVLMKLGAFGIIRVGLTLLPAGMEDWALVLFVLATINVLYGAFSAMAQTDLKYVIGYSSVSHMGYVLMGIATLEHLGLSGANLQMFSHGVMTALFFAVVGAIYERTHVRDIGILNGLAKRMRFTTIFFVLAGLASLGLPGLSGFIAEVLVFMGAFRTEPILAVFGVIGVAITAVYILRLVARVFFGPLNKQWDHIPDMSKREIVAASILAVPIVFIGVYPQPFLQVIDSGITELLSGI